KWWGQCKRKGEFCGGGGGFSRRNRLAAPLLRWAPGASSLRSPERLTSTIGRGYVVHSPIHELGGRASGVGSMSRVELPPGARPFVPQRDLLQGGPSDQRRHRLARVALLGHLLREPMVQHAFHDWATRYGLRQPVEALTTRLDTLAFEAGLSSRTALFSPESTRDAS